MKTPILLLPLAALTVSVHATPTPTAPPLAATMTVIADTTSVPLNSLGFPIAGVSNYAGFEPPVVSQFDFQTVAYKASVAGGSVTPMNDEGVWSSGRLTAGPGLVLREGDPVLTSTPPVTYGLVGVLTVENLQSAGADAVICATNTSDSSSRGKVGVAHLKGLNTRLVQSPVPGFWNDIRPPVCDGFHSFLHPYGVIATWADGWPGGASQKGVFRMEAVTPVTGAFNTPACLPNFPGPPPFSWLTGFTAPGAPWKANQPARLASPAISPDGYVATFARPMPALAPNEIRLHDPTGCSFRTIVKTGDLVTPASPPYAPAGARFGVIHNALMAVSNHPTIGSELVTWQMQTMTGTTPAGKTSLWCKWGTIFQCLAWQTQAAPDLPAGNAISSFYELQAVPDSASTTDHFVFWGAMLNAGKNVAIYRTHVVSGFASPPDLIASDAPGTPTLVMPLSGGTTLITNLDRFFSVNVHGWVLFKANILPAPPGQRQVLVTDDPINGRKVRVQSGGTSGITAMDLARPEQGPMGRGQAMGTQWFTARLTIMGRQTIGWFNGL